jgi:hypothetical protein
MAAVSGESLVMLRGGLTAQLAPYLLLIRLEADGIRLRLDADGHLWVDPFDQLQAADAALLRQYRPDVIKLLRYVADDRHLYAREAAHA